MAMFDTRSNQEFVMGMPNPFFVKYPTEEYQQANTAQNQAQTAQGNSGAFQSGLGIAPQQADKKRPIGCDQVAHLSDALDRYAESLEHGFSLGFPGISRNRAAAHLAALLEIMEVLGCEFADDEARRNAIADFPELAKRGL